MSLFSADVNDLRALYVSSLQKALNSEKQIVEEGLPAMIAASTNPQLAQAFRTHLAESETHASRVEAILNELTGDVSDSKCKATSALISEASSEISDAGNEAIRDVVLIAGGNKVEHHEIAVYGTLRTWAVLLGFDEHAVILEKTLEEEKHADKLLTQLAESINMQAPAAV